jgi:hypothetical protein
MLVRTSGDYKITSALSPNSVTESVVLNLLGDLPLIVQYKLTLWPVKGIPPSSKMTRNMEASWDLPMAGHRQQKKKVQIFRHFVSYAYIVLCGMGSTPLRWHQAAHILPLYSSMRKLLRETLLLLFSNNVLVQRLREMHDIIVLSGVQFPYRNYVERWRQLLINFGDMSWLNQLPMCLHCVLTTNNVVMGFGSQTFLLWTRILEFHYIVHPVWSSL